MIVGKKIENSNIIFTLDGSTQNAEKQEIQALKFTQPSSQNKKTKLNKNQISKKPLNNTKLKENKKNKQSNSSHQIKQKQESDYSSSQSSISSEAEEEKTRITLPVSGLLDQIRPKRTFKPLSEQFPNILRQIDDIQTVSGNFDEREKKINEKKERQKYRNSSGYSSEEQSESDNNNEFLDKNQEYESQQNNQTRYTEAEEVEEQPQNPPKPEKQPYSPQKQEDLSTKQISSNQKQTNKENKPQQSNSRKKKVDPFKGQYEQKRKEKLENREKIKNYGKQQIVRAHTFRDVFEHKQSWGADQQMIPKIEEKKKSVQNDVKKQREGKSKYMEQRRKERENISSLFPEKRESRFKKIWEQEARSASRKRKEVKEGLEEPNKTDKKNKAKSLPPERVEAINRLVQQNAKRKPEIVVQAMQKKLEQLHKKAQIKVAELKQKEALQKCKKVPFVPPWFGFDMDQEDSKTVTKSMKSIKNKDSEISSEINDISETNAPISEISGGIVVSKKQFEKIQKRKEKKKNKVEKINKSLSQKQIKVDKKIKYTSEELMIKDQIRQDALLESKILKEKQKLIKKTGMNLIPENKQEVIDPVDLGFKILEDANLPQLKIPIEEEQRVQNKLKRIHPSDQLIKNFDPERDLSYKDQVEEEIKRQIKNQKSQPVQKRDKYDKPKKTLVPLSTQKPAKSKLIDNMTLSQSRSKQPQTSQGRMNSQLQEKISGKSKDVVVETSKKVYKSQQSEKKFKTSQISEIKSRMGDIQFLDEEDQPKEDIKQLDFEQIFERDLEEAIQKIDLDSIWKRTTQMRDPFKNDSDDEDEDEFIKITQKENQIERYYENPKIKEVINPTKAKEKSSSKKSVSFTQQPPQSNSFIEQFKQGKRELESLVLIQKLSHPGDKQDTGEDEKNNIMRFSKHVFQSNNPFPSDILELNAKDLMDLPELYL